MVEEETARSAARLLISPPESPAECCVKFLTGLAPKLCPVEFNWLALQYFPQTRKSLIELSSEHIWQWLQKNNPYIDLIPAGINHDSLILAAWFAYYWESKMATPAQVYRDQLHLPVIPVLHPENDGQIIEAVELIRHKGGRVSHIYALVNSERPGSYQNLLDAQINPLSLTNLSTIISEARKEDRLTQEGKNSVEVWEKYRLRKYREPIPIPAGVT